jgi:integrase
VQITTKAVAALTLPANKTDAIFFDDNLTGFGIRLRRGPDGGVGRSYVAQYRHAGRSRRVRIADVAVLTADQARAKAKKILAEAALGGDPQAAKTERRAKDADTFRSAVDAYLGAKQGAVRKSTAYEVRRYLTGKYFRPLHNTPLDKITRRDVSSTLLAISRENGVRTASVCRSTLSAFFSWAIASGILDQNNPVTGTPRPTTSKPRKRVLSDDELVTIWNACREDDYGRIGRLLILTGCRRQEVGGMGWAEIQDGIWTIPGERTKNGQDHAVPLPPQAIRIIETVPRWVGRNFLFGTSERGYRRWSNSKRELDERSGVRKWMLHDIRRTVATRLGDLKVPPHVIEVCLNHVGGFRAGVAGTYNRAGYVDEVRAALTMWARHVEKLVTKCN